MIELFVRAAPGSNIQNAEVTLQGPGVYASVKVDAGSLASARVYPLTPPTTQLQLSVRSAEREVSVFADNVFINSVIHILGIDRDDFRGDIHHTVLPQISPNCELRCTPAASSVTGPGCLDCNVGELKFTVCC